MLRGSPLTDEDLAWIKWLDGELWKSHESDQYINGRPHQRKWRSERRELTLDEIKRLVRLSKDSDIFFVLGSGIMGFGYSIAVYKCSPYPGIEAEPLVAIACKHVLSTKDRSDQKEKAWKLFSTLALSQQNQQRVAFHGFERQLDNPAHYDY